MEIVIRITVIYLFIFIGMRILGKREFGQMTPFELVTLFLIPEIVSDSLIGGDTSLTGGLTGVATLFCLVFLITIISHLSERVETVVEGAPAVLVQKGDLLEEALNKERVNPGDILTAMHRSGIERLEQVKWAILESDGKITIIPEEQALSGETEKKDMM